MIVQLFETQMPKAEISTSWPNHSCCRYLYSSHYISFVCVLFTLLFILLKWKKTVIGVRAFGVCETCDTFIDDWMHMCAFIWDDWQRNGIEMIPPNWVDVYGIWRIDNLACVNILFKTIDTNSILGTKKSTAKRTNENSLSWAKRKPSPILAYISLCLSLFLLLKYSVEI